MQIKQIREPGSALNPFCGMRWIWLPQPPSDKGGGIPPPTHTCHEYFFMLSRIYYNGAKRSLYSEHWRKGSAEIFRKLDHMMIFVLMAGS